MSVEIETEPPVPEPAKIQIPGALIMADSAWDIIEREALKAGKKETGGVLVGRRISYAEKPFLVVVAASGPGPKSDRKTHTFAPEVSAMQKFLDSTCDEYRQQSIQVDYLGEWHKHPVGMSELSSGDIEQGRQILTDPSYYLEYGEIVLPVATLNRPGRGETPQVKLNVYYLSRLHPSPLELNLMIWESAVINNLLVESILPQPAQE